MAEEWICQRCCWWDGNETCLKSVDHNFDGDGIKGCTKCEGFVEIEDDCFTSWVNK